MAHYVYDHNGQKVAAGLRQIWIDPTSGETFVVTASVREGDALKSTLRKVSYVADLPAPGAAPAGGTITLKYEVPA